MSQYRSLLEKLNITFHILKFNITYQIEVLMHIIVEGRYIFPVLYMTHHLNTTISYTMFQEALILADSMFVSQIHGKLKILK